MKKITIRIDTVSLQELKNLQAILLRDFRNQNKTALTKINKEILNRTSPVIFSNETYYNINDEYLF